MSGEGYVTLGGLRVHPILASFLRDEVLPGSGIDEARFWQGLTAVVDGLGRRNRQLLARRRELQSQIDTWHRTHPPDPDRAVEYRRHLERIGYVEPPPGPVAVMTEGVDGEISDVAGPQLIVPASNPRYALNAVNARWGSLYDALYGTNALGDGPPSGPYDPARGAQVVAWARRFLDEVLPLTAGSHADAVRYHVGGDALAVDLRDGQTAVLADRDAAVGFLGPASDPSSILLRRNGLHVELVIDRRHPVGATDHAGVADVLLESAITTIIDFEDSVAAVDAEDKVLVYRTWLGLMRGDLSETFAKEGRVITRVLNDDRSFRAMGGDATIRLPGRALMFARNVGLHMETDAVLDRAGRSTPEGFLDAMVTVVAALHDLRKPKGQRNSRFGSVYVVKPKLHGSEEAAFVDATFALVEDALGLPPNTVKVGLMDEERRTSVNLARCIGELAHRLVFVNTGFLDRTGDEIHTSMEAGPAIPKAAMKRHIWFSTYESRNVQVALDCGLRGRGQIGKGMWAAPDQMAELLRDKIDHVTAGATCAWVPSPTAATLHATHYHRVAVREVHERLITEPTPPVDDMLTLPLLTPGSRAPCSEVVAEVENNVQSILGYVVRWIDQGIGCSKVLDNSDVALMEDRATCRISAQHVASWLHHGLIGPDDLREALRRMAARVDAQNDGDPAYQPMAPSYDGPAFRAACDLVFAGGESPSGYTEPILHAARREAKLVAASGARR